MLAGAASLAMIILTLSSHDGYLTMKLYDQPSYYDRLRSCSFSDCMGGTRKLHDPTAQEQAPAAIQSF